MNLKTIINLIPFVVVPVMLMWGFLTNAWNISRIAFVVGGILMGILSIIYKGKEVSNRYSLYDHLYYSSAADRT